MSCHWHQIIKDQSDTVCWVFPSLLIHGSVRPGKILVLFKYLSCILPSTSETEPVPASQWTGLVPDLCNCVFCLALRPCGASEHTAARLQLSANTSHTFPSCALFSLSALLSHTQRASLPTISVARMVVRIVTPFIVASLSPHCILGLRVTPAAQFR